MFKKLLKLSLTSTLLLGLISPSIAHADSGASAMPPEDTELQKYYYKTYAPKTQTTYKKMTTVTQKVGDIRKEGETLIVGGTDIMAGGGALSTLAATKKKSLRILGKYVGATSTVGGAVIYFTGRAQSTSYSKFKKKAKVVNVVYFKWTDPKKCEYSAKIVTFVKYKGKRVSKKQTFYYNKSL